MPSILRRIIAAITNKKVEEPERLVQEALTPKPVYWCVCDHSDVWSGQCLQCGGER